MRKPRSKDDGRKATAEAQVDDGIAAIRKAVSHGDLEAVLAIRRYYEVEEAVEVIAASNRVLAPLLISELRKAWAGGPLHTLDIHKRVGHLLHVVPSEELDRSHKQVVGYLGANMELNATRLEEYAQRAFTYMLQASEGVPTSLDEVQGFIAEAIELGFHSEDIDALIRAICPGNRWEYPGFYGTEPKPGPLERLCGDASEDLTNWGERLGTGIFAYEGILGTRY